jgi:NDP-sugar pyrophosphorylase family protein
MITSGGIIAAGEGRRLKLAGVKAHKPLVSIAGFPLIGHMLRQFAACGIRRAIIIFNEEEEECVDWVRKHFAAMDLQILVRSTKSSFESFSRVGCELGAGRHLICAVDSICSSADLLKMISSEARSAGELLLGVTAFVHDEKPLWVRMEPGSLRIRQIGGAADSYATAGLYNIDSSIFERQFRDHIPSLRVFLQELVREGVPASAVPLAEVIDVDTIEDICLAERFISERGWFM